MITVKKASPEYADGIAGFQIAMALETESLNLDKEIVKQGVRAVFRDLGKGRYFIALDGDKLIASLMITYEWSDWRNGTVYWIQSVFVLPEYRGKGVFKQMYLYIKDLVLNDPALTGIRLYVDKTNRRAQKVYEKMGMDGSHYQLFEWMK
jgi:GNAT superfamily N-acetyltransferase